MGGKRIKQAELERMQYLYVIEKRSYTEVAARIKRDRSAVARQIRQLGLARSLSDAGKLRSKPPRGEKSPQWKGGRFINITGYAFRYVATDNPFYPMANSKGYIPEHRFIMAQYLGRLLTKGEIVHHLNGIRADNRLANLGIVMSSNHSHHTLKKLLQKRIRGLEAQLSQQKLSI